MKGFELRAKEDEEFKHEYTEETVVKLFQFNSPL